MNKNKLEKLNAKGWQIGSVQEFLNLSDNQARLIEAKLARIDCLEPKRKTKRRTPTQLAHPIKSVP